MKLVLGSQLILLQVLLFGLPWALYIELAVCVWWKDEILTEQFIAHMNTTPLCLSIFQMLD